MRKYDGGRDGWAALHSGIGFPIALRLAAALPVAAGAQLAEIGGRIGTTSSSVIFELPGPMSAHSNRNRRTPTAGVYARRQLSSTFSLQPELLVVGKGFERTEPTLHFAYLELPVLLRTDFGWSRLRGFVVGGPAVAYELACRVSFVTREGPYEGDCDAPSPTRFSTATRAWDVSAVFGGGIALRLGLLIGDARYTLGLRDVGVANPSGRTLNRSVVLSVGYGLLLGRLQPGSSPNRP